MKRSQSLAAFTLLASVICLAFPAEAAELVLRYEHPAGSWQQEPALARWPGGIPAGRVDKEPSGQ